VVLSKPRDKIDIQFNYFRLFRSTLIHFGSQVATSKKRTLIL